MTLHKLHDLAQMLKKPFQAAFCNKQTITTPTTSAVCHHFQQLINEVWLREVIHTFADVWLLPPSLDSLSLCVFSDKMTGITIVCRHTPVQQHCVQYSLSSKSCSKNCLTFHKSVGRRMSVAQSLLYPLWHNLTSSDKTLSKNQIYPTL